jgi:hypothetical protein
LQPADESALLAAEALVRAWKQSQDVEDLLQAAAILQYASQKSTYRNQIRLALVRILRLLGLPSSALKAFHVLNMRSVQYETLAHFASERSSTFQLAFPEQDRFIQNVMPHHYINQVESSSLLNKVWSMTVLPKVEEYQQVVYTLQHSFARAAHSTERTKMDVLSYDSGALVDATIWSKPIQDMRDVNVLPQSLWKLTEMGPRVTVRSSSFLFRPC